MKKILRWGLYIIAFFAVYIACGIIAFLWDATIRFVAEYLLWIIGLIFFIWGIYELIKQKNIKTRKNQIILTMTGMVLMVIGFISIGIIDVFNEESDIILPPSLMVDDMQEANIEEFQSTKESQDDLSPLIRRLLLP